MVRVLHGGCQTQTPEPFPPVPDPLIFHRPSSPLQPGGHANVHATADGLSKSEKQEHRYPHRDLDKWPQSRPSFADRGCFFSVPSSYYHQPFPSHLLDDFDNYSRQFDTHTGRHRSGLPIWLPKFDMRETGEAYELHGELPGIMKENVNIEFAEPQVMVIRGKVERSYSVGKPPAGHVEGTAMSGMITEGGDSDSYQSRQPSTVEDEDENATVTEQGEERVEKPADKAKYWLSERSMGEFSRTFNFPVHVDQDGVTANFKDGILSVLVPKAKKHEKHRHITIN